MKSYKLCFASLTLAGALAVCLGAPGVTLAQTQNADSGSASSVDSSVARLMSFDANHDGKLQRSEITDKRLLSLFDRIDSGKTGTITRVQVAAYFKKQTSYQNAEAQQGGPGGQGPGLGGPGGPGGPGQGPGFGGPGGPGQGPGFGGGGGFGGAAGQGRYGQRPGFGGPGGRAGFAQGRGFGGPVGRGAGQRRGFGAPPRPGEIMPEMLQNQLKLTDDQKIQLAIMQKDLNTKLAKLLTPAQNKQLEAIKAGGAGRVGLGGRGVGAGAGRGPGGGPGPGGRGGFGRQGGRGGPGVPVPGGPGGPAGGPPPAPGQ